MDPSQLLEALKIDETELDRCVREQPVLFFEACDLLRRKTAAYERAKATHKTTEARVASAARARIEKTTGRATNATVDEAVLKSREVRETADAVAKAADKMAEAEALKQSFQMRSHSLRDLCMLTVEGLKQQDSYRVGSDDEYKAKQAKLHAASGGRRKR